MSRLYSMLNCKETLITPSYIGVRGYKRADSAVKLALDLTLDKFRILYTDLKPKIKKFLQTKWQQRWNNNIHNKLFQIQSPLGEWRPVFKKSKSERVIISACKLGIQDLLTFSYWNRTNNHSVWYFKPFALLNTFSLNVDNSHSSESDFSRRIVTAICQNEWHSILLERNRVVPKKLMNWNHWSYKTYSLFLTETGTTTTVFDICKKTRSCFSKTLYTKRGSSNAGALGTRIIPSLPSLPGPLWFGVVAPIRVLSMGQIELFDI